MSRVTVLNTLYWSATYRDDTLAWWVGRDGSRHLGDRAAQSGILGDGEDGSRTVIDLCCPLSYPLKGRVPESLDEARTHFAVEGDESTGLPVASVRTDMAAGRNQVWFP